MSATTTDHRYTRETADRMLPLLRAILADTREAYLELQRHVGRLDGTGALARLRAGDLPEAVADVLSDVHGFLRELSELSVRLESPDLGLVSFPGLLRGHEVNFCWKLGEDRVRYWFARGATYDDRRPIDPVLV
jgi:hypothetical protein